MFSKLIFLTNYTSLFGLKKYAGQTIIKKLNVCFSEKQLLRSINNYLVMKYKSLAKQGCSK